MSKGMEKTKATQRVSNVAPIPHSQPPAAHQHRDQPLATRFVPFVVYTGGRPLSSFNFVFYEQTVSNSYLPFYTVQTPFCGYRFREGTRHIRKKTDLESADYLKWRPIRSVRKDKTVVQGSKALAIKPKK